MKQVAIYARYSRTVEQHMSLKDQIDSCMHYAELHGFVVAPDHIYADMTTSSTVNVELTVTCLHLPCVVL